MIVHRVLNFTLKRTWEENDNRGLGIECILNWKNGHYIINVIVMGTKNYKNKN